MHDFTELDRNINLDKPQNYHLSIRLSRDGFSFCLLETYIGRYVGARHYQLKKGLLFDDYLNKIGDILSDDDLLKREYKSVSLMHVSNSSILIPGDVFKEEDVKSYFTLNKELGELDEIHYNYNSFFKLYNVFSIHHELLNIFRKFYPQMLIYHQWSSLLKIKALEDTIEGTKVYVNFNSNFFDLLIVREGKPVLCNAYIYGNENDFVFYLLNALKQTEIDPAGCVITIIGETINKGRYFDLLGKFVKSFEIGDIDEEFSFSPSLKNVSKPIFYNLYNLYRCVLSEAGSEEQE